MIENLTMMVPWLAAWAATPMFLWAGLALASIPIIIHLLNRRRYRIVRWAAMEYLLAALRKNRRRLRFEQILLLATRCLLLALLGLALARPQGCADNRVTAWMGQRSALHVFVIDNSYSMAYEADRPNARTHLDQAKLLAKQQIEKLTPGTESVAIVLAGRPTREPGAKGKAAGSEQVALRPTYDLEAAKSAVDRIGQSWGGTDLPGALQAAAQVAREETRQPEKFLYILSDCTRSAFDSAKGEVFKQIGRDLTSAFGERHMRLNNLGRESQWNYAVRELRPEGNLVRARLDSDFLCDIKGYGGAIDSVLQWKWDDKLLPDSPRLRPALDTPLQRQNKADLKEGGIHVLSASLVNDERLKIDNAAWRVVSVASEMKVLIVEGDRSSGATTLDYVLAPKKEIAANGTVRSDSYVAPEVIGDLELGNKVLADYRAIILTNVAVLSAPQADQLKKFVAQGGTLMLFMGEQVRADVYNSILHARGLLPGKLLARKTVPTGGTSYTFNFRASSPTLHPVLSIFRGEEQTGLDAVPVDVYYQLELDPALKGEVVLKYLSGEKDTNDPAIIIHPLDKGRIVTVTTSATSEWNSLPQRPAYPVLVHELLSRNVDTGDRWMNIVVGQSLRVPPTLRLTISPKLTDPNRQPIPVETVTAEDGQTTYRSRPIDKPGLYQLDIGNAVLPVAVNVPADEADIRAMPNEAVRKALGEIDLQVLGDSIPGGAAMSDDARDLGWFFMLVLLALVGVECFLAMHFGRQWKRPVAAVAPVQTITAK